MHPKAGQATVGEYAAIWLTRQVHLKASTRSRYSAIVRVHIEQEFGTTPLAKLDRSAVSAWIVDLLDDGIAGPTVRHIHRVLYMILNSAIDDAKIARNPAARIKLPRDRSRDKRFLTHDEVQRLAAAGPDSLAVLVLAYCGLRFGELAALRVRNVDPIRRRLQIEESATEVDGVMVFSTPKSHQCRSVPVPRSLIDDIATACAVKQPGDLVFTAPKGGVLWLRNWRRRVFDPAVAAAGLGKLTPHELRHTAASLAVAAGANLEAPVRRMLRHASAAMTLRRVLRALLTTIWTPSRTVSTPRRCTHAIDGQTSRPCQRILASSSRCLMSRPGSEHSREEKSFTEPAIVYRLSPCRTQQLWKPWPTRSRTRRRSQLE